MNTIKDQRGIAHLLPVLTIGILLLVGGSFYLFMQKSQDAQLRADNTSKTDLALKDVLPANLDGIKPLEEISELALKDTQDVAVHHIELTQDKGVLAYKVVRDDQQVVLINAKSGAVISTSKTATKADHTALPAGFSPGISLLRAREIAALARPNSNVSKIHLSMEQNALTYSVRFTDKSRVDISAEDGAVLRVKDTNGKVVTKAPERKAGHDNSDGHHGASDSDGHDDPTEAVPQPSAASRGSVTRDQAVAIANERLPEKPIKEVKDELEYGIAIFSVRYEDGSRIDIRKSDGAIVRAETR